MGKKTTQLGISCGFDISSQKQKNVDFMQQLIFIAFLLPPSPQIKVFHFIPYCLHFVFIRFHCFAENPKTFVFSMHFSSWISLMTIFFAGIGKLLFFFRNISVKICSNFGFMSNIRACWYIMMLYDSYTLLVKFYFNVSSIQTIATHFLSLCVPYSLSPIESSAR